MMHPPSGDGVHQVAVAASQQPVVVVVAAAEACLVVCLVACPTAARAVEAAVADKGGHHRMNQDGLGCQMYLFAQQRTDGCHIHNDRDTNTVTIVYTDGGPPMTACMLSRISNP